MLVDAYVRTIGGGFYLGVSCLRPGYDDIPPSCLASGVSIQKNVAIQVRFLAAAESRFVSSDNKEIIFVCLRVLIRDNKLVYLNLYTKDTVDNND